MLSSGTHLTHQPGLPWDLADMIILLTTYAKNRKRNKLNGLKLSLLTELLDSNWGNFDQKVT